MPDQYPSTYLQNYPRKIAFLIDCVYGLNSTDLSSRLIEQFPVNSDLFLFYYQNEPGMNRRLKRLATNNHGVFFFPTSADGIALNISFILGQMGEKYEDLVVLTSHHPAYEDLCKKLIADHPSLTNHIQFRTFENVSAFEQFLAESTRLHSRTEKRDPTVDTHVVHYGPNNLFHSCPCETVEQSSIVYRFGELLHHLDTEHENITYDYCSQCQQMVQEHNDDQRHHFEEHIQEHHWNDQSGFQLTIRSI